MKKVEVYLDRRSMGKSLKRIYSIRDSSRRVVVAKNSSVFLQNVELVVQPSGRAETLQRTQQRRQVNKTVHAFLRGSLLYRGRNAVKQATKAGLTEGDLNCFPVGYDPVKTDTWVKLEDYRMPEKASNLEPVISARYALLHENGILVTTFQ